MDIIFSCIGLSHSLFAVVMILTKRPVKIAYVILCTLLLIYGLIFGLDILQYYNIVPSRRWFLSLSLRMLYAPLFFLYAKYITRDFKRFNPIDFCHAIPSVLLLSTYVVLKLLPANKLISDDLFYDKYLWLRMLYGWVFIALIGFYVFFSIRIVLRYKQQLIYSYSYSSFKNSLDWLLIMIVLFVILIIFIVIASALYEQGKMDVKIYIFRHLLELFHVYVLSIWGFQQNQLISAGPVLEDNYEKEEEFEEEMSSGKYVKSGLKSENAKIYMDGLLKYMDESEVWKDSELSIGKLAVQTSISKHQLSEVLNEYLGKSFYVFVNEYRVEYAKRLLADKGYRNWSIIAIAYECGFNSKTAFNNFFKKNTQFTPSEFKKNVTDNHSKGF